MRERSRETGEIMSNTREKIELITLQLVPVYGVVLFPSFKQSLEITQESSVNACLEAKKTGEKVFFVPVLDVSNKDVKSKNDLYEFGTVGTIHEYLKLPGGKLRIVFDGLCRANLLELSKKDGKLISDVICRSYDEPQENSFRSAALMAEINRCFDRFVKFLPKLSDDLKLAAKSIRTPSLLADFIAMNVLVNFEDKYEILSTFDPTKRCEKLVYLMEKEIRIFETELNIHQKVVKRMEEKQREHFLREQMNVIQDELGYDDDDEIEEYFRKIEKAALPKEVEERLTKEVNKLRKMPYTSAESTVLRDYLDTCLELPWSRKTPDRLDIDKARKILDRDHDGLEDVKERIIEFLSVKKLNPELKNQIICLVGPPGTGKTSIAHSIAEAMRRKYVRVSLGGIRDEAEIRGHRKTYIGSMPGRIITALASVKVNNPLMLLDEVDKLSFDGHGDPASALLEVLDGEQNKSFRDHYIEMPFDLSDVMFLATANSLENIQRPLLDRMEIIELHTYTTSEKLAIAKNHLIPKQMKRHGLTKQTLRIEDSAVLEIIDSYTRESGVRNLERKIGAICRKAATFIVEGKEKKCIVRKSNIEKYLGFDRIVPDVIYDEDEIGTVNGLAYTEVGGEMLRIECAAMEGSGKLELTGSLGNVMKESAQAALTYVRMHASELGVDPEFHKKLDIHLHFPEGAVPKDGPSAGVSILTSLVSELTHTPVRRDVAMTGEITLHGRVLAIGGLREKTMAAYKAGVIDVIIPYDNRNDLEKLDKAVREKLRFTFVKRVDEVLSVALCKKADVPEENKKSIPFSVGVFDADKRPEINA